MSIYDEDGNYPHKCRTNAQEGVCCDSCITNIAECEGGKLYEYNGSWLCRECFIELVFDDLPTISADDNYYND